MANFYAFYPSSASATNPSTGTNGQTAPASSTEVGGVNPSGNLQPISVDASGNQNVNVVSSALPAGAATAANQATANSSLSDIDSHIQSVDAKTPALGQAAASASVPVVLPAAQITALTPPTSVAVNNFPATQAVSGSVSVTNFPATQAVSGTVAVSTLPSIPAGSNAIGSVSVSNFPASQAVTGTFFQATQPVSAASLPLPTGASTAALQTTISGQLPASLGAKTTSASLSVTLASDQATLATKQGGRTSANAPVVTTYATPVTSAAYTQLIASTTSAATLVEIFDSSGVALYFAVGAAGSEVNQFVIYPGGNGQVSLSIAAGSRISIKAVSTSASGASAYNVLNLYS